MRAPFADERRRDGRADAGGAAGDQRDLAVEAEVQIHYGFAFRHFGDSS